MTQPTRNSITTAICSGGIKVGACPTLAISTTFAMGPRWDISCAVSGVSRSDRSPRRTNVGQRILSRRMRDVLHEGDQTFSRFRLGLGDL